jgi:tetratricopeptide (TPR) repeat protein
MSGSYVLILAILAAAPSPSTVRQVLESCAADSLFAPLARFEAGRRGSDAAEAASTLGLLHYARGEYRQAAAGFARATARADPARRGEAQYWTGLAWLGAGEVGQARVAFEEAARSVSPRRPEAQLGVALCREAAREPERALEMLQTLLGGEAGEAGPAALERIAGLAARFDRPELARRARERLSKDYPRSIEAVRAARGASSSAARASRPASRPPASAAARLAPPPIAAQVPLAVQIGVFREESGARELAERARREGFGPARVAALTDAGGRLFAVRVGVFATAEDARGAGGRLGRALGVAWRVVPVP